MATETAEPTWKEKIARNWANVRLGHEAMMLDKILKEQKRVFHLADKVAGKPAATEDDMGVAVGNEIHNHYTNTTAQQTVMGDAAKKLIPLALAAALGSAVPLAFLWWNKPPAATQPTPAQPQTDWQLGIEVVNP